MGTYARFVVESPNREIALTRLESMVALIESVEAEISTWRTDSQFSQLNRMPLGEPLILPKLSCHTMQRSLHWWTKTEGLFDLTVSALTKSDQNLNDPKPSGAKPQPGMQWLKFDPASCSTYRMKNIQLDLGAIGKGIALDAIATDNSSHPDAWLVDFGGQVSAKGKPWPIVIANPFDTEKPVIQFELNTGSISTSATYRRALESSDPVQLHILDPRTDLPITYSGSVSVWHPSATDADALSTALVVMGIDDGLTWAEKHSIAALFITKDRQEKITLTASKRFQGVLGQSIQSAVPLSSRGN